LSTNKTFFALSETKRPGEQRTSERSGVRTKRVASGVTSG